jgi:hypothetical protein
MLFTEAHLKEFQLRSSSTSGTGTDTDNPLNRLSVGGNEDDAQDKHAVMHSSADQWRYATSVDVERSRSNSMSISRPTQSSQSQGKFSQAIKNSFRKLLIPFLTSMHEIRTMNVSAQFRKAYVLNRRAFYALFKREKLVIGTTLMYVYIAVFTCFIIKPDQENNPGVATANGMFGAFLLLVSQLQYVFFLFNNHKVFNCCHLYFDVPNKQHVCMSFFIQFNRVFVFTGVFEGTFTRFIFCLPALACGRHTTVALEIFPRIVIRSGRS